MDRTLRSADSHEEAAELDQTDLSRLTFEERINAVDQLRKVWFGEDRAQPRLERVAPNVISVGAGLLFGTQH